MSRADPELQKRFGKGTRYDLKARATPRGRLRSSRLLRSRALPATQVVLRGDIGTGKSALLKRLRGGGFSTAYEPRQARTCALPLRTQPRCRSCFSRASAAALACYSAQISTAKISWKCPTEPDDVISVDVWDVVDRCGATHALQRRL